MGADMLAYEVAPAVAEGVGAGSELVAADMLAYEAAGSTGSGAGIGAAGAGMFAAAAAMLLAFGLQAGKQNTADDLNAGGVVPDDLGLSNQLMNANFDASMVDAVGGSISGLRVASYDFTDSLLVMGQAIQTESDTLDEYGYKMIAFNEATQSWVDQTGTWHDMIDELEALSPVTDEAVVATASYVAAMHGIPSVADELVAAYNDISGSTAIMAGTVEDSVQSYIESMTGFNLTNKEAIRITDALRQVKSGDIDDTRHLSEALKGLGLTQQEVRDATSELVDMFGPLATGTDILTGALARMGSTLGSSASASRYAAAGGGNDRDSYVPANVPAVQDYNARASGGPASGLTWVGEQGPELVNLPPSSHVYSNRDSVAMSSRPTVIHLHNQTILDGRVIDERVDKHIVNREERGAIGRVTYR